MAALGDVNRDARPVVGMASVAFPLAAVLASSALARHRNRTAGLMFLLSVGTPTYFAYVLKFPLSWSAWRSCSRRT